MTNKTTGRTEELSFTKRHLFDSPALTASLACVPWIHFDNLSTASYCFVGQHLDKAIPRRIRYMLGKAMVSDHSFDIQILNCNEGIGFSYSVTHIMQEVSPLIGNFEMLLCQPGPCLSSVSRTFDFSTESSLQEFQSMFRLNEISRVSYDFTIAQSSKVFQTNINTNHFNGWMFNNNIWHFTTEDSKTLPCFVLLDCENLDFTFGNTMQDDRNVSYFAEFNPLVRKKFESRLGECYAVHSALETRESFLFAGLIFDSAKEVSKSFVNSIGNILLRLRMNFRIFTSKIFVE